MLTPSIRASRTSAPSIIRVYAFSTQVTLPPFLNQLPLADEMTTARVGPGTRTAGALPKRLRGAAAASPAAAPARTKSRREKRRRMEPPLRKKSGGSLAGAPDLPNARAAVYAGADGIPRPRPLRQGDDAPRRVLHLRRDLRGGEGAHLRAAMALRRTRRGDHRTWRLPPRERRQGESRRSARERRPGPSLLQRLPPPRHASLRRARRAIRGRYPVPLPRLDLRA